ncbi:MAG: AAA domain-containing protein [Candidatus Shapirobacteria bacterium]|nr:AAA domain-containing protein [Candidatus Shapirobacteria bacterium]
MINTLIKDEVKLIQGPPGTGKSQSITAIISNALANNAKCLVVCEKKTALDVIQANLVKVGLDDFSVVIDDIDKDRRRVIEKARDINDSRGSYFSNNLEFDSMYKLFCKLKAEINSKHSEALKKVFGDYSWKTLIGLYLKLLKDYDLDKIMGEIDHSNFAFDYDEYARYLSVVEESSFLFSDLGENSEKIFSIFADELFQLDFKMNLRETILKNTSELLKIICETRDGLKNYTDDDCHEDKVSIFKPDSIKNSIPLVEACIKRLKKMTQSYDDGVQLIGEEFYTRNILQNIKLRTIGLFNPSYKDSYKLRQDLANSLEFLTEEAPLVNKYLSIELPTNKSRFVSFRELNDFVVGVLENLNKKYLRIKAIEKIEKELNANDSKLYTLLDSRIFSFKYIKYTDFKDIDSLNKYYLSMYDKTINVINNFDSYENFHHWRHYLSDNKTVTEINIINALKEISTKNWKNVFMTWYFKKALLNFDSKSTVGFNKSDAKLAELSVVYNKLKEKQVQQIKSIWNIKRRSRLRSYSGNFNTFYNLRKNNSGPKNSLRKIIEKDFDLFTSLFPIILTNPSAANAILPLKQGLFNVIIFDEASQLRISDTFACLIRGQFKIIAGDEHQMPPSNYFLSSSTNTFEEAHDEFEEYDNEQDELADSESLLQYASNLRDINKSTLDYHYRSNHPALIEFSNAAFYGGNLVSFPASSEYTPIKFIPVNGRYESNTNPTEVAEVIRIIKDEIQLNQNNKYPSVGIATFNINQRNLIIESLNKAAELDSDFLTKYLALKESGLFIKNLENIQGDEKDIIIISTTYGYGVDGKFSQNFARINRIEGYKLLNVLITRAKNKVYVCTSIPKEKYVSYPELIHGEGGNNKRGILYAYLAYAEAISNKDSVLAEGILSELRLQSFEKPKLIFDDGGLSESPFEEEVYDLLLDNFGKDDVIQQHKVGGFRLDFVVKYNGYNYVLECDGKSYHQSEEAYAYDMYRQKELEHMGYVVYRIWSTNWFQNKELEMTKFMNFVNKPEAKT